MSRPERTKATLRIWGDDLFPEEISKLLGVKPTMSERKGDVSVGKASGNKRVAKTGNWSLESAINFEGDLDAQVNELFAQLSADLDVWRLLAARYSIDVVCGVFMQTGNDGFAFNAATLRLLGERGARLDLDIYDADN